MIDLICDPYRVLDCYYLQFKILNYVFNAPISEKTFHSRLDTNLIKIQNVTIETKLLHFFFLFLKTAHFIEQTQPNKENRTQEHNAQTQAQQNTQRGQNRGNPTPPKTTTQKNQQQRSQKQSHQKNKPKQQLKFGDQIITSEVLKQQFDIVSF